MRPPNRPAGRFVYPLHKPSVWSWARGAAPPRTPAKGSFIYEKRPSSVSKGTHWNLGASEPPLKKHAPRSRGAGLVGLISVFDGVNSFVSAAALSLVPALDDVSSNFAQSLLLGQPADQFLQLHFLAKSKRIPVLYQFLEL